MDNNAAESEIQKIREIPNVLHADAVRHGEYDFGSYKRGFIWAKEHGILKNYDWVYFVNDSAYGPFRPLGPILNDLESRGADFVGMCKYHNDDKLHTVLPEHVQSWFFGLSNKIANSDFINEFMNSIKHQDKKMDVVYKYEVGLSQLIFNNGFKYVSYIPEAHSGLYVMEKPIVTMSNGLPFLKKQSIRHIVDLEILNAFTMDTDFVDMIQKNIKRCKIQVGYKYMKKFRFTIFGVPIISVQKKYDDAKWKLYLFDTFPIAIIYNNTDVQ
jgi:lipopolysaccharide biosynthesis protein